MDQVLPLLLLLVFLVSAPSTTATTYYVLADGGDDCPTGNECHPLSHYTSHSDSYFTNNTVFYFLKGNHYMNESVIIQGKSNITLTGTGISSSIITCSLDPFLDTCGSNFTVHECDSINITHLSMYQCHKFVSNSWGIYMHSAFISTLSIENCMEVSISDSSFMGCNPLVPVIDIKYSPLTSHTITDSVNATCSLVNCNIQGGVTFGQVFGLRLSVLHEETYTLNVLLSNVTVNNTGRNIVLDVSHSYFINVDNVTSFDGNYGLQILNSQHGVTSLSSSLVITYSEFYNNLIGVSIELSHVFTKEHLIKFYSCEVYDNGIDEYGLGFYITRRYPTENTSVYIEDTIIYHNSQNQVINYDRLTFTNVSIYGTTSTGLTLNDSSVIYIEKSMAIFNNTGTDGGGIALYGESLLVLTPNTKIHIYNNTARYRGGGLFGKTHNCPIVAQINSKPVFANISDNTAVIGNDIYGFDARQCYDIHFNLDIQQVSYPVALSFCNETIDVLNSNQLNESLPEKYIYSGQLINFSIAIYSTDYDGNNFTITDGTIQVGIENDETSTVISTAITGVCSDVSYQIIQGQQHTREEKIPISDVDVDNPIFIFYTILPCPIGFTLSGNICDCSPVIGGVDVTCDITTLQLSRTGLVWIGTDITLAAPDTTNDTKLCLIKEECFLCTEDTTTFTLNETEYLQCRDSYNRSGILCGQCRDNYSLILGSNKCQWCEGYMYINLLLIILFAALGIILVLFLLLLNLTVSQGTLNGIIFYANIVKLYQPVFSRKGIYPFFNQVLLWFNLDFGIETCFFHGMDNYSKTWLQYAFPFYLWFIIVIIILISQKSSRVARLNPIPVLSTLFLLSYTKIVRTVVDGLHLRNVTLHCENETTSISVWYIDPNLPYTQGKHAWLFGFSLIMLVLFCIPYTLFLLFNPLLERYCQNYRCCHFLFKLKPIFDAYNGQVKDKYRFWSGLLLVARLPPLFSIAFIGSLVNESRSILLTILLTDIALLLPLSFWLEGVYEYRLLNILESWFLINLIIMIALAFSITDATDSKIWFTCFIAIFFISFVVIVVYHFHLKLLNFTCYKSAVNKVIHFNRQTIKPNIYKYGACDSSPQDNIVPVITRSSFWLQRHDSITELFDPPNDEDYYIENNHSF